MTPRKSNRAGKGVGRNWVYIKSIPMIHVSSRMCYACILTHRDQLIKGTLETTLSGI